MTNHPRRLMARVARAPSRGLARTVALCAALVTAACDDREVPGALVGRWTSDDPRYAGRSLSISPATIEFGTGATTSESFLIDRVESVLTGDGVTLHDVHYRDAEGSAHSVRLELVAPRGPTLRIENHDEVWVRENRAPESKRGGL
ncbi:MAG: hypothetical protein IT386_08015 [Deltaproteobacteria bacterium]|nr:hypothetical protein [Deltaproteobacteria bacterium]